MTRCCLVAMTLATTSLVSMARADEAANFGPAVLHDPIRERRAEQGILRPVPIAVTLPADLQGRAYRVLVHYRLWGEPDWTALELRRAGEAWRGAIPCLEVSTVSGMLRYYLRVHDADGEVIATGASQATPYAIAIRHDTHLASDAKPLAKCPDPADCPRGLPGCPSERVVAIQCRTDADCADGDTCGFRGICEKGRRRFDWWTATLSQEAGIFPARGGCDVHAQEQEGYACFREDGLPYIGNPVYAGRAFASGRGMTRVALGYERLVHYNTTLGVRLGWALFGEREAARGAPAFVPFHGAARLTHWFGDDPLARQGFRPHAFLSLGYAQTDIASTMWTWERPDAPSFQGGNDLAQRLTIHRRAGDAFVGGGVGLGYAFESGFVPTAELAVVDAFPFGALVLVGTAGVMVPFGW